jgi:hypothetical protein
MRRRGGMFLSLAVAVIGVGGTSFAQMPGMGGGSGTFIGYGGHNMDHDLILPQVAVGEHYTTSLVLYNIGNSQVMNWVPLQDLTTTGKVYFYHQDGTGLPVSVNGGAPASEFSFSLGASKSASYELSLTGSDSSGWALIDIDEPASGSGWGMMDGQTMTRGMRIMADVFYTYSESGQPVSRVGVVPSMYEMGRFATSVVSAQSGDGLYTGVAVVNVSSTAVTVTMSLRDSHGNTVAAKPLTLNPGNQAATFIHELFPAVLPDDFQGLLEVSSSNEGIATMGLLVSHGILTSIPMMHYGQISMMH